MNSVLLLNQSWFYFSMLWAFAFDHQIGVCFLINLKVKFHAAMSTVMWLQMMQNIANKKSKLKKRFKWKREFVYLKNTWRTLSETVIEIRRKKGRFRNRNSRPLLIWNNAQIRYDWIWENIYCQILDSATIYKRF